MKLDELKDIQMTEMLQWVDTLDNILTPDNLVPSSIKEFPSVIETSNRLKRICKMMADDIKKELQHQEDVIMDAIENAEYIFKYDAGGMPVLKKKYPTSEKQKRELRFRLNSNDEYQRLALEQHQWMLMYSDWVSHCDRLRRELRLLEVNYQSNGGDGT